ncbi:MAG: amidase family protein, partial [Terrimesophilobacter sp.]
YGCVPLSASMDHVGPMARTAADCAILLAALAGEDPRDAATVGFRRADYPAALSGDLTGLTVGVDYNFHARVGVPDEMLALFDAAVSVLESAGARVVEVALPFTHELYAAVRVVMAAEAFEVHRTNLQEHWDRYGRPTRLSLSKGAMISGADYVRAARIVARSRGLYADALAGVDLVASPTCPIVACRFEEIGTAVISSAPLLTTQWNGLGMPAISVPMGMMDAPGADNPLPAGLQLAGTRGQDAVVLRAADAYQRRTGWHDLKPDRFS